jgi:hypothetical protein
MNVDAMLLIRIILTIIFAVSFIGLFIRMLRNKGGLFLKILASISGISLLASCLFVYFFCGTIKFPLFITEAGLLLMVGYIYSAFRKKQNIYQWLLCIIYVFPFYFINWPDILPVSRIIIIGCTITSVFGFFDRVRNNQKICNIFLFAFLFFFLVAVIIYWKGLISVFAVAEYMFRFITFISFFSYCAKIYPQDKSTQNMLRVFKSCFCIYGISLLILIANK